MAQKLPKVIDRTDAERMLLACNCKTTTGLRNRVTLQLMYRCGLRIQEVCNLAVEDVDFKAQQLYVQLSKDTTGGGGKDRRVYADPETLSLIHRWLEVRPACEDGFLLCTFTRGQSGKQLDQRAVRAMVSHLSRKCGVFIRDGRKLKAIHPHILRHTYATERLEDGWTIAEVQRQLGHANLATTSRYLHVRDKVLAEKAARIAPVGG